jgi:hypothetical protein
MSSEVRLWTAVAAGRVEVFSALSDPEQLTGIIDGLRELRPVGAPGASGSERGNASCGVAEGSKFSAVFQVGPKTFHQTLSVATLDPGHLVVWKSMDAGGRELSFRLEPGDSEHPGSDPAGTTRILLTIAYEVPDGIKGAVLKPMIEEGIRMSARSTLHNLKARFGAV